MKKLLAMAVCMTVSLSIVACGNTTNQQSATTSAVTTEAATQNESTQETTQGETAPEVSVMTYAEYAAAAIDTKVTVETYVQAKQAWWENKATIYTQNEEGAFFVYEMPCTQEEYDKLVAGTKIRITGYKAEWSGEIEIADASYEVLEGSFVATATDVTEKLGKEELADDMNKLVSFTGLTVEAANDKGDAFMYNWDGSGSEGNDLYFNASINGETYTFTVESYLCDKDSDVYKAVKELKVGDVIDMEGFLYWYNGANPHITSVTVK